MIEINSYKKMKKQTTIQNALSKILSSKELPILNECKVKNGILSATDLTIYLQIKTNLKDGMYWLIGNDFVPTQTETEDFPIAQEIEENISWEIENDVLSETLKLAAPFISRDSIHPKLNGAYLKSGNGEINIITSDSFRLYSKRLPAKITKEEEFIIPDPKKVASVLPIIGNRIGITNGKEMVKITGENGNLIIRKINNKFPDVKKLFQKWNWKYIFNKSEMNKALKEIKPYIDKRFLKVEFEYVCEKLILSAENEIASKSISINAKIEPTETYPNVINDGILIMPIKNQKIAFNLKYLVDILNSLKKNEIYFYSVGEPSDANIISSYFFTEESKLRSI